jgi:hypothetical protein
VLTLRRQQSQLDYAENKTKRAAERLTENERPMAKAGDKARKAVRIVHAL